MQHKKSHEDFRTEEEELNVSIRLKIFSKHFLNFKEEIMQRRAIISFILRKKSVKLTVNKYSFNKLIILAKNNIVMCTFLNKPRFLYCMTANLLFSLCPMIDNDN